MSGSSRGQDNSFIIPKEVMHGTFRCGVCGYIRIQIEVAWPETVTLRCGTCQNKAVISLGEEEEADGGS